MAKGHDSAQHRLRKAGRQSPPILAELETVETAINRRTSRSARHAGAAGERPRLPCILSEFALVWPSWRLSSTRTPSAPERRS